MAAVPARDPLRSNAFGSRFLSYFVVESTGRTSNAGSVICEHWKVVFFETHYCFSTVFPSMKIVVGENGTTVCQACAKNRWSYCDYLQAVAVCRATLVHQASNKTAKRWSQLPISLGLIGVKLAVKCSRFRITTLGIVNKSIQIHRNSQLTASTP